MEYIFQIIISIVFISSLLMHASKRNRTFIGLYALQSLAIVILLFLSFWKEQSLLPVVVVLVALCLKVIMAPLFFGMLVQKSRIEFSASTYLNTPISFAIIALLVGLAHSDFFGSLVTISKENQDLLAISIAVMLLSVFLIANRKGVLSQMIGILSLENGIVAFIVFAGLEQMPVLQLGILFDLALWVVIATIFAGMVYKQFGSLDSAELDDLQEE